VGLAQNLTGLQAFGGRRALGAVRPSVAGRPAVQSSALLLLKHALLIKPEWCQEIFERGKAGRVRGCEALFMGSSGLAS